MEIGSQLQEAGIFATMATPAVLLLANAMLILSTVQRLQAILARVRENESGASGSDGDEGAPDRVGIREELEMHARRVELAHRALFSFYASAAVLLVMIAALGAGAAGWPAGTDLALFAAFAGAGLLFLGTALLTGETWVGVRATDARVGRILRMCDDEGEG